MTSADAGDVRSDPARPSGAAAGEGPGGEEAGEVDELLAAVDAVEAAVRASDQRRAAMLARAADIRRLRGLGASYRDIVVQARRPLLVALLRDDLDAMTEVSARLRRTEALVLHREGMTMDRIAEQFGVTRQRVSELLRSRARPGPNRTDPAVSRTP